MTATIARGPEAVADQRRLMTHLGVERVVVQWQSSTVPSHVVPSILQLLLLLLLLWVPGTATQSGESFRIDSCVGFTLVLGGVMRREITSEM